MNQTQNETQNEITRACIAELQRERDQLRAWQRNALAVTKRQAEKIKALETERDGLQQKLANCHSEMDKQIREIAELTATIDRMREPLCRAAEQQACNERLMAELAKAPRWVPVGEWVRDSGYHVVYGSFFESEPTHHDAKQNRYDVWLATNESKLDVTHVLANLNQPEIAPNEDQERLREMAAKEGNGCISVGGLACRIKNDELQTATEPPECSKTEWRLSLFRAIKSLKLSIYSLEISGFQRLDAKKRSVGLTADEAAEHERLTKCAEWVFDDTLPG